MRGKESYKLVDVGKDGITPAYAGKSWTHDSFCLLIEDHPRLCGEKFIFKLLNSVHNQDHPRLCGEKYSNIETCVSNMGSPPPMRGKGTFIEYGNVKFRITPAYAGKSCLAILPVCF